MASASKKTEIKKRLQVGIPNSSTNIRNCSYYSMVRWFGLFDIRRFDIRSDRTFEYSVRPNMFGDSIFEGSIFGPTEPLKIRSDRTCSVIRYSVFVKTEYIRLPNHRLIKKSCRRYFGDSSISSRHSIAYLKR